MRSKIEEFEQLLEKYDKLLQMQIYQNYTKKVKNINNTLSQEVFNTYKKLIDTDSPKIEKAIAEAKDLDAQQKNSQQTRVITSKEKLFKEI